MAKAFLYTSIDNEDQMEEKLATLFGRKKIFAKYLSAFNYAYRYRGNSRSDNQDKMDSIVFIKKQLIETDKGKGYVYFFKYREKKDDKWRIAISGMQPADSVGLSYKNLYTKFTDEKIKEDEPLDDQLNFQLKKIIFANREGSESFFVESKGDYNYRNFIE
jgi:hypothetical protein